MPSVRLKIEVVGTGNVRFAALPLSGAQRVITHRTAEGRRTASVRAYTPPRLQKITLTLLFDVASSSRRSSSRASKPGRMPQFVPCFQPRGVVAARTKEMARKLGGVVFGA